LWVTWGGGGDSRGHNPKTTPFPHRPFIARVVASEATGTLRVNTVKFSLHRFSARVVLPVRPLVQTFPGGSQPRRACTPSRSLRKHRKRALSSHPVGARQRSPTSTTNFITGSRGRLFG
jgi:hypothetical protein